MQTLFNTADGLANCSSDNMKHWLWRFISDEALAVTSSNILLYQLFIFLNVFFNIFALDESFFLFFDFCYGLQIIRFVPLTHCTYSFVHLISSGHHSVDLYSCPQQCIVCFASVKQFFRDKKQCF